MLQLGHTFPAWTAAWTDLGLLFVIITWPEEAPNQHAKPDAVTQAENRFCAYISYLPL